MFALFLGHVAMSLSFSQRSARRAAHSVCMVRSSSATGSWTKPCTVPLSFSLRIRDRLCNVSSMVSSQRTSTQSRLPIPMAQPPAALSPPLALSPSQWPDAALLWLFMWHANFTFLHIPRTGGQSVERIDHRAPVSWFKALRLLDVRRNASHRQPSLTTQILTHGRHCHRAFGSPWRFTPELLQHCEVPAAWNPYIHGTTVYCILREPFSRFVSIFLEVKRSTHWPHRTCDLAAPLASQLQCFAQHAASILQPLEIRRAYSATDASQPPPTDKAHSSRAATKQRVVTSEVILSMLPQSHFVSTGRGEPTCDITFQSDHLRATGIPSIGSSSEALTIMRLLQGDVATKQLIKYVYREDFTLWDRVQSGTTPTMKHASSLSAHFSRAARALPEFFARPPVCTPSDDCTCSPHCCDDALAAPDRCAQCVLSHAECGGPGVQAALQVPRAVAPVCKQVAMASEFPEHLHTCNTCEQCCNRPWVDLSGPSCFACEARSCVNDSRNAGSGYRRQHRHSKHSHRSEHSHSEHGHSEHSHSKHNHSKGSKHSHKA